MKKKSIKIKVADGSGNVKTIRATDDIVCSLPVVTWIDVEEFNFRKKWMDERNPANIPIHPDSYKK